MHSHRVLWIMLEQSRICVMINATLELMRQLFIIYSNFSEENFNKVLN